MSTQTDVKAKTVSGTGALTLGQAAVGQVPAAGVRLKGFYWPGGTAGTVAFTDGGASGPSLVSFAVPTTAVFIGPFPGEGIRSVGDPYVTYTTAVGVGVLFYG
jgi:hypothetical protein